MNMKKLIKMAVFSLVMLVAMHVCAQDHLTPYGYDGVKNYSRENYVCWGFRVEFSLEDIYEIKCIRNDSEQKYYLVMNEKKLEMDEELAYNIRTLFDVAVLSSTFLPEKSEMSSTLEVFKTGGFRVHEIGLDGQTFYFYNNLHGASCWSPGSGNNVGMVAVGMALINASNDVNGIKAKLTDIKNLTKAYIELLQEPYREYFTLRMDKKPEGWWYCEY